MNRLPPSASVVTPADGDRLLAPSAVRNLPVILALVQDVAPAQGRALEIASGTGQHIAALAAAHPAISWQPSDLTPDRLASIDAHATGLSNLRPAKLLDAAQSGWADAHDPYDLIYLGNLLHLIPQAAAETVLREASRALAPKGALVVYGPFMRAGVLTSEGDLKFHTELRAADSDIGYKDDIWVAQVLTASGLSHPVVRDMPANNLSFIARRESP